MNKIAFHATKIQRFQMIQVNLRKAGRFPPQPCSRGGTEGHVIIEQNLFQKLSYGWNT